MRKSHQAAHSTQLEGNKGDGGSLIQSFLSALTLATRVTIGGPPITRLPFTLRIPASPGAATIGVDLRKETRSVVLVAHLSAPTIAAIGDGITDNPGQRSSAIATECIAVAAETSEAAVGGAEVTRTTGLTVDAGCGMGDQGTGDERELGLLGRSH